MTKDHQDQTNKFIVVFVTTGSSSEAKKIANSLVEEKIAACVNIIPKINSIYSWKGKICDEEECLCIIKTREAFFDKLKDRVKELHSYEVAEIIGLPIVKGSQDYLDWIMDVT